MVYNQNIALLLSQVWGQIFTNFFKQLKLVKSGCMTVFFYYYFYLTYVSFFGWGWGESRMKIIKN